tara:strand:+ start:409 stop:594 length:186 start_codon:yes stop_codon:yes gene_type:complete
MREIILKVLSEVACNNTGTCQINLQSKSAQIMIADKLMEKLEPLNKQLIEDIVCGGDTSYE